MKCLILAAGYATRLYPLTENFPKPLLKVGEKSILDWLVDDLVDTTNIDEFVVISNHKLAQHFDDWKLDLRIDEHTELEIFAEKNPPKRVNRPEACGLRHLAFRVESVEETVKELAEMGIECEPIRTDSFTGEKMTFFFDPDGLPLEIHE